MYWLRKDQITFPNADLANADGILAVGGDLSAERLIEAYQNGIFPWFNPEDPIIWWSPNPRFVLFPDEIKVSKSMRPYFNQKKFKITCDTVFEQVIKSCSKQNRSGQRGGTWITDNMVEAYVNLHRLGYAHSVEVWNEDELVGGLYGISLGKIFFGESMFSKVSNASKFGFITLVKKLTEQGYNLIDCQQETNHLASLGARSIPRKQFLAFLADNESYELEPKSWKGIFD